MIPRLSLLVEVPPYDDPVAAVAGLRCRGVEVVVGTDDARLSRWPGVVRVDAGRPFLNRALARASAPAVAIADSGGLLDGSELDALLAASRTATGTAVVYSDERVAGVEVRKPAWSPLMFENFHYLGRLTVLSRQLVVDAGGFPPGEPAEAVHRLVLGLVRAGVVVRHFPRIAYERLRDEMPSLLPPGAVPAPTDPVSVLIPTAGTRSRDGRRPTCFAVRAVESVRRAAGAMDVEVVVSVGPEADPDAVAEVSAAGDGIVRVVRDTEVFDFSRRVNLAAAHSRGRVLVWLNDDVERNGDDGWLATLAGLALEADVGAVGAKLLYPDRRVQTAGVRFRDGLPTHVGVGAAPEAPGPLRAFITPREQAAVTGAVLATRTAVFDEVGGLSPTLPINFGDTDYCLKVRQRGYRVVLTPTARLRHHESASRAPVVHAADLASLLGRWPDVRDPYWPWPDEVEPHPDPRLNGAGRLNGNGSSLPG